MKKIIAWLLVLAMVVAISIGATLAYLTDTDEDVNVMTLGNVKIDQLEYERIDDETANENAQVQEFHDNKPLLPAVTDKDFTYIPGDTYVDWDQIGKDGYTSEIWNPEKINNELDKMVFIKNNGKSDAYVRTVFAFEAGKYANLDEFKSMMHLNLNETDFTWEWIENPVTIGDSTYFVATATYNNILAPGALTEISLSQIALDKTATNADVEAFGETYQILVKSQGIQEKGFTDAATALTEGFGAIAVDNIPWESDAPTTGTTLRNALRYLNGETTGTNISSRVINAVFALNEEYPEIAANYDATLVDIEQDVPVNVYYVPNGADYDVYFLANDAIYAPQDCTSLFSGMNKLVTVDAENLDVSRVTNAKNMFLKCPALKSVFGTADWDTGNITCMSSMFDYCGSLVDLEVGGWDTGNVTAMDWMFFSNKVTSLDVSNWDTGNVTDMHGLFSACINLETVDVSKWDVSKVTSFAAMFQGAASNAMDMKIKYLDLTNWNPSSAVAMNHMFYGCAQMTELDISGWNMPNLSTTSHMFADCINLNTIDVSGWQTPGLTSMDGMFNDCRSLKTVDMSSFDTSKVQEFSQIFESCWSLIEIIGMENWDTSSGLTFEQMFMGAGALKELNLSGFNTSAAYDGYVAQNGSGCVAFGSMFNGVSNLTKLIVSDEIRYHGNGTVSDGGKLVFPNPAAKEGYTAMWQNVDTKETYLAKDIPEGVAATYVPYYQYANTGATMKNALHYLNADPNGTKITTKVTNVIFGLTEDYADIANTYTGVLADQEQDGPVYAYYVPNGSNYDVYFLSENKIFLPASSKSLFAGMSALKTVTGEDLDTSRVTTMYELFYNCRKLENVDVSQWDVSQVTNMCAMFENCSALTALNAGNWNTGKVTNMSYMFHNCPSITTLDVSGWNPKNVTTMYAMFALCSKVTTLDVSNWDTSNVTNVKTMFKGCTSLQSVVGSGNLNLNKATDLYAMFENCSALEYLDVSNWGLENVTAMTSTFGWCSKLTTLEGSENWKLSNVTSMIQTFCYDHALTDLDVSTWDTSGCTDMSFLFKGCRGLTTLAVENWDVSKVKSFGSMFSGDGSNAGDMNLTHLNLSKWDMSSAQDVNHMFYGCAQLTAMDLSGWNVVQLKDMNHMFADCYKLETVNFAGWKTDSLTNLDALFNHCKALKSVDLSMFNTSKVTVMCQMFEACYSLEEVIGLENFDTSKVTDFSEMFTSTKLTKLDLSSFDTSSAKIIYSMFNDNPLLETIYVGDGWDMSNATSYNNMFGNCVKLVGGNGTTFAGSDLKYACVDTEQTPGYLTYKSATT